MSENTKPDPAAAEKLYISRQFIERSQALELKGKKRDDALMNYLAGAANVLVFVHGEDSPITKSFIGWMTFKVAFRGWNAITEVVDEAALKGI